MRRAWGGSDFSRKIVTVPREIRAAESLVLARLRGKRDTLVSFAELRVQLSPAQLHRVALEWKLALSDLSANVGVRIDAVPQRSHRIAQSREPVRYQAIHPVDGATHIHTHGRINASGIE